MPPEFVENRKISAKFDVFSLGVTIIQIMAGPLGHDKFTDRHSNQEFIELVRKKIFPMS